MYPITRKEKLADRIFLMDVKAPRVPDTVFRDSSSSRRSTRQESESP